MRLTIERKIRKAGRNIMAVVLSVAIIVSSSGISAPANSAEIGEQQIVKEAKEKVKVVKEIKKLRTENSNTYLMSDKTKKLEIYAEDI